MDSLILASMFFRLYLLLTHHQNLVHRHTWPLLNFGLIFVLRSARVCPSHLFSCHCLSLSTYSWCCPFSSCSRNDRTWPWTSSWTGDCSRGSGSRASGQRLTCRCVSTGRPQEEEWIYLPFSMLLVGFLHETGSKEERLNSFGFVLHWTPADWYNNTVINLQPGCDVNERIKLMLIYLNLLSIITGEPDERSQTNNAHRCGTVCVSKALTSMLLTKTSIILQTIKQTKESHSCI